MVAIRWSSLVRYGLIGPGLLGLTTSTAAAERCDDVADRTVGFTLGLQVSPQIRVIAGVEGRACLSDATEAMLRFEVGGGKPRFIAGARVRPLEGGAEDSGDHLGLEAGAVVDIQGTFAAHLAATFGTHSAYLAAQARVPIDDSEMHVSVLAGLAPWTAFESTVVEGRPLVIGGRFVRPSVFGPLPIARSAEQRAVRDHFVGTAQLELSSVWTFLRLAAELVAVGAPAALVAAALDAADDEVRHAELCAGAAGGLSLAGLPMGAAAPRFVRRTTSALSTLAAEAWCEGCLNEGAAAEEARLAAGEAQGAARAMLAEIARDEARHAELSWAVLTWVMSIAPDAATHAISSVPAPLACVEARSDAALARHGVPSGTVTAAARAHADTTARRRLGAMT